MDSTPRSGIDSAGVDSAGIDGAGIDRAGVDTDGIVGDSIHGDRRWDLFLGVVAAGVTVATIATDETGLARRLVGVGSIVAITALYAFAGRRLLHRDDNVPASAFIVVAILLFGVGTYAASIVSYLLFALCPLIFLVLTLRRAIPLVVFASFTPLICAWLRDGWDTELLTHLGPIFVVSAALAVWLGTWINRVIEQSRERAALIAELRASRAEVARLSHETGVAAERQRLAGEIHDTLAQGFTSIITLLQAADPALRDERLALAVRTARENLAESRTLIAALTPTALSNASLADAIRRQAASFTAETGIPASVRVTGEPRELPTPTEVVLLRAAQEALTNIRRHAGANEVDVLLAYAQDVRLVVRDDGAGFDAEAAGGFGLKTMRARAEQAHGTLIVRSDPDTGTTLELEVPA
ncbi:sensor histidine kinase [Actinoplanes sp. NPDC051633]|uniref:sensor histidine kinase n=1 Tax=Actinoplanes sp. NPDC051633 TaxID=3155670 RepID=UPI0034410F93